MKKRMLAAILAVLIVAASNCGAPKETPPDMPAGTVIGLSVAMSLAYLDILGE